MSVDQRQPGRTKETLSQITKPPLVEPIVSMSGGAMFLGIWLFFRDWNNLPSWNLDNLTYWTIIDAYFPLVGLFMLSMGIINLVQLRRPAGSLVTFERVLRFAGLTMGIGITAYLAIGLVVSIVTGQWTCFAENGEIGCEIR